MTNNDHNRLILAGPGTEGDPYHCPYCGQPGAVMETTAGAIFGVGLQDVSPGSPIVLGGHLGSDYHHMWWTTGPLEDDE